jgi:hypothetical protein
MYLLFFGGAIFYVDVRLVAGSRFAVVDRWPAASLIAGSPLLRSPTLHLTRHRFWMCDGR